MQKLKTIKPYQTVVLTHTEVLIKTYDYDCFCLLSAEAKVEISIRENVANRLVGACVSNFKLTFDLI